jgi:hypothetical protein
LPKRRSDREEINLNKAKRLLPLVVVVILLAVIFIYREWVKEQIQIIMTYSIRFRLWEFVLLAVFVFLTGFVCAVVLRRETGYEQGYIDGYRLTKAMAARAQLRKKKGIGPPIEGHEKEFEEMMAVGKKKDKKNKKS